MADTFTSRPGELVIKRGGDANPGGPEVRVPGVVLIDPASGLPYAAGAGGGGSVSVDTSALTKETTQLDIRTAALSQDAKTPALVAGAVPVVAGALPLPTGAATSALQSTANSSLGNIDADLGAKADAVATTDIGTFSLVALVKRSLQNWTSLLAKIPALVSGRIPVDGSAVTQPVSGSVTPVLTSGGHVAVTTSVGGAAYTAFGSQVCKQVTICNGSGIDIGVTVGGAGVEVPVFAGTYMTFFGLTNTNQLSVRRVDTATAPVTVPARWEA